jgi:general secretion pathway protein G
MNWLAQKPDNYAGEYFGSEDKNVVSGQWYFDLQDHSLVYLIHNRSDAVTHANQQQPEVRYTVRLVEGVTDSPAGRGLVDGKSVEGVILDQTTKYSWE